MTYYISDLHFGHKNILSFDNRPFKSIEEHDKALINNWNEVVGIDDDVWILGDFSWYNATKTIEFYKRLNGNKHLCIGNHDKKLLRNKEVRGDQYVTLVVQTPTGLNNEAKEALRHFDELTGGSLNRSNAGGNGTQEKGKKKKGFMDKLKESLDDL